MKKILLSLFMCMLAIIGMQAETVTDVLTADDFAATSTTYTEFSDVKKTSDAVYAGQSAKNSDEAIQLRSSGSNCGIVSTTSGGNVKSVTITVSSGTKQIDVYGSNTAYTSAANLYATTGNTNQGDLLGSLTETGTITVTGDYKYVGIRSKSGAIYLSQVDITWEVTGEVIPQQLAAPTFSPAGGAVEAGTEVTITAPEGSTLVYTVNDGDLLSEGGVNTATVTINEETTIEAYATQDGFEESEVVTATYTIEQPFEPTVFGKVVDVLNLAFTGMSGTNYNNWADKVGESGTKYLGNSAGGNDAIQLRSTNSNSGIVSDRSVGTVKKVTVAWNANTSTSSARILQVYGKNTAYTSAADLYAAADSTKGTLLGTIKYTEDTELVIEGDYKYIGLRSSSGAMYIDEIQIEWYVPYPETITAGMYYLVPGKWENEDLALYGVKFVNVSTGENEWVQGFLNDHYVYFQLDGEGEYTHLAFYRIANTGNKTTTEITDWDAIDVLDNTPLLTYTAPGAGNIMRYNVDESKWEEVAIGTGVNRVELAGGIGYAYGVVSAEGAIEVYNVNGAVVARGNDNVDLRGLGRGVYIIRNGNQVRKVVR